MNGNNDLSKVKFFLRFGKRKYLEGIKRGCLSFCPLNYYRELEKGRGDNREGAIPGIRNAFFYPINLNEIPIYCLFSGYKEDLIEKDGKYVINVSQKKKEVILRDFHDSDSVIVIRNPQKFINDIVRSIGTDVESRLVNYARDDVYIDTSMMDEKISKNGEKCYVVTTENAKNFAFYKEGYYKMQQEYRVMLPNENISTRKTYYVNFTDTYDILDIDDLFNSEYVL